MAGPDLGKQIGPLPLGAWVAVVAGGLGIAVYTRRTSAAPAQTEIPVDTSADAGVGTGAVGGFVSTAPPAMNGSVAPAPTTNDEWGALVENGLIARNYPASMVDSMVRKYIAGQSSTMSPQEWALLTVALGLYGAPPQILPPDGNPPTTTPPGGGTTPPVVKPPVLTNMYTMRAGQSMYEVEKIAHPSMNAAQANNAALLAIHYNTSHGINPWPRGVPGPALTQYKVKRAVKVYVQ